MATKQQISASEFQKRLEALYKDISATRVRDGLKVSVHERWKKQLHALVEDGRELHRADSAE